MKMTVRTRLWLLATASAAVIAAVLALPPVAQPQAYHAFADHRTLLGIPHGLNVLSNVPFLLVGLLGLAFALKAGGGKPCEGLVDRRESWPYAMLFLGVALVGLGSAYYHLHPGNQRLVWDRLPMTLAFLSLLAAVLAERIDVRLGIVMLGPLLAAGMVSVLYWWWSEGRGAGDLRPYLLAQFFPLLMVPLLVLLFPARYTRGYDLVVAIAIYGGAKALEGLDQEIFRWSGGSVSGHTLKHLAAALAAGWILRMLVRRRLTEQKSRTRF
ncbi:MAG: ceramidase domain-containing protein [Terriglobales bacterium]